MFFSVLVHMGGLGHFRVNLPHFGVITPSRGVNIDFMKKMLQVKVIPLIELKK